MQVMHKILQSACQHMVNKGNCFGAGAVIRHPLAPILQASIQRLSKEGAKNLGMDQCLEYYRLTKLRSMTFDIACGLPSVVTL